MKSTLLLLWMLLTCTVALADRQVKLAWDPVPGATSFRVWLRSGLSMVPSATVPVNHATLTLPDAPQVLAVTALNAVGESDFSSTVTLPQAESTLPPIPKPPPQTYRVELVVRSTTDMVTWETRAIHFLTETDPKKFYQLQITTIAVTPP